MALSYDFGKMLGEVKLPFSFVFLHCRDYLRSIMEQLLNLGQKGKSMGDGIFILGVMLGTQN